MQDSVRLGKISGIPIGFHWSIALIAGLFSITLAGTILPASVAGAGVVAYWAVALTTTALLLASIIAHELGHSIVAKNNDVKVSGITLFALGGVAKLESEPDDPGVAGRIALAGPAVSVAIGIGSLGLAAVAGSLGLPALLVAGVTWLGIVNLVMAVFNMIPALPLDGGRALQAFLWRRTGDRNAATISAARLGRYIGLALVVFGLWQFLNGGSGLWTALIGWFIASSARAESFRAKVMQQRDQGDDVAWPFAGFGQGATPGQPFDPSRYGPPHAGDRTGQGEPLFGPPFGGRPVNDAPFGGRPFGPAPNRPPSADDVIEVDGHRVS